MRRVCICVTGNADCVRVAWAWTPDLVSVLLTYCSSSCLDGGTAARPTATFLVRDPNYTWGQGLTVTHTRSRNTLALMSITPAVNIIVYYSYRREMNAASVGRGVPKPNCYSFYIPHSIFFNSFSPGLELVLVVFLFFFLFCTASILCVTDIVR